jgi:hypothetical protein
MIPITFFRRQTISTRRMPSFMNNLTTQRDSISIFLTRFVRWEDFCPRNFPANDFAGASFSHSKMTDVLVLLM